MRTNGTKWLDEHGQALLLLGRELMAQRYDFVTVTPDTQRRVNERADKLGNGRARSLRDVFGWSRPFELSALEKPVLELMRAADALDEQGELCRSRVRFSSLGGRLFVHSAFPTLAADSVFFGPDTYRFCSLLERWVCEPRKRVIDVGCGSGAGGIHASPLAQELVLTDINTRALRFAAVNAALANVDADVQVSDVLSDVSGEFDLVMANPPYMHDEQARAYRDGGGAHGEGLSVRIVESALSRLAKGGMLVLYTGSAVVDGEDTFYRSVAPLLQSPNLAVTYEEIDPDVFGEELELANYRDVDRIAAVGLRVVLN